MSPEKLAAFLKRIGAPGGGRSLSEVAFAELLAELARETAEQSDKNLAIQNRLVWQTWVVLAVALIALALQAVQVFRIVPDAVSRNKDQPRSENQKADLQSPTPIESR